MAKSDAPNYRKATGSKKCGNCKAWDADATDDPMTGYCKWYDLPVVQTMCAMHGQVMISRKHGV